MTGLNEPDDNRALVRVTVNLAPRAADALAVICSRTGDTKTDSINRALTAYRVVLDLMDRAGGSLTFVDHAGQPERIHLL